MLKRTLTTALLGLLCLIVNAQNKWIDVTDSYIVNPRFDNNDVKTGWMGTEFSTANPKENAEHYSKNYDTYQYLYNLPAGTYRLSLNAFYRMGNANNDYNLYFQGDYSDYQYAELYAISSVDEYTKKIEPASSGAVMTSLGGSASAVTPRGQWGAEPRYIPNNMEAAYYWFEAGFYVNTLSCKVGDDGEMTIGIRKNYTQWEDWTCLDNWKLEYWGTPIYVSSLTFDTPNVDLTLGETMQLTYTITPSNTTYPKVTWESSDPSIVKVDNNGNITGLSKGEASIFITSTDGKNIKAECKVKVSQHEATAESLIINEIMSGNTDQFIDPSWNYGGWIELYNPTSKAVGIAGFYISDDPEDLMKCRIKMEVGTVPAYGYKCLWFDHIETRKDISVGYVNTQINFKLNASGGTIYISNPEGELITTQEFPECKMRLSYARTEDGGSTWGFTYTPTPELSNDGSIFASEQLPEPIVDKGGQIFEGILQVCVNIPEGAGISVI